ncbi:MAG: hypothetical protein F9K24_14440 [Leptonema illini]|uniref:DUF4935 domain-containing protein n=1 Tax=Leptonema illini TaxID=183 RepID=A0A833H050_9LEPT|nr:MAG: hypothetical protein F9K24_14440 [Leptonema illini]
MIYVFLDTSIWLDLASTAKLQGLVHRLDELSSTGRIVILANEIVKDEIERHIDDINEKFQKSIRSHIKAIRDSSKRLEPEVERKAIGYIDEISIMLNTAFSNKAHVIGAIKKLFVKASIIPITNEATERTKVRGLRKQAPFHSGKNGVADSLIIESYFDFCSKQRGANDYYFITTNSSDFCQNKGSDQPHPDFAQFFGSESKYKYSVNIGEVLESLEPSSGSTASKEIINFYRDRHVLSEECLNGGVHEFSDDGQWFHSRYGGGLSWHVRCRKCGMLFDTGDYLD